MAFFLPPTHMLVHSQFNVLWGFWSHTEVVEDLGPLEHIFVTPKHHRVHHGMQCIIQGTKEHSYKHKFSIQGQTDIALTKIMLVYLFFGTNCLEHFKKQDQMRR